MSCTFWYKMANEARAGLPPTNPTTQNYVYILLSLLQIQTLLVKLKLSGFGTKTGHILHQVDKVKQVRLWFRPRRVCRCCRKNSIHFPHTGGPAAVGRVAS